MGEEPKPLELTLGSLKDPARAEAMRRAVEQYSTGEVEFRMEPTGEEMMDGTPIVKITEISRTYRRPKKKS